MYEELLNGLVDIPQTKPNMRPFDLLFRPIYNWESQKAEAFYSLLQINSENVGALFPEEYTAPAENDGFIADLQKWVAVKLYEALDTLELRQIRPDYLSMRISPSSLHNDELYQFLSKLFYKTGIGGDKLCIRLPHQLLFELDDTIKAQIVMLRELGVKIMLGGFGTDFCPLMRLAEIEADSFLLDTSLLLDLNKDSRRFELLSSLISFLNGLGADVIADGVDTFDVASMLAGIGCIRFCGKTAGEYTVLRKVR